MKTWNGKKLSHKGGKEDPPNKKGRRYTPKQIWLVQQGRLKIVPTQKTERK